MPSVLEQLGIDTNLSAPAGGETGLNKEAEPNKAMPVTEATQPAKLSSSKEIAETIIAGAIIALEQVVAIYGYTTEEGKKIARAIDNLSSVVPESKIKEVQGQLGSVLGGNMLAMQPLATPPTGMPISGMPSI
jgi:hypothetical protein